LPCALPWAAQPAGLLLTIRLTPKGGRDAIEGVAVLADGSAVLKARVRAAPSEGEANAALVKLLAKSLDVAPGRIGVVSGAAARVKRVMVAGDGVALAAALEKMAGSR
jgi:uncharacterized protein YggU (UPF0235/DUF167 family)